MAWSLPPINWLPAVGRHRSPSLVKAPVQFEVIETAVYAERTSQVASI